jgi:hypothetical protein
VKYGYDPEKLSFADDNKHKLQYETPEGKIIKFGAAAYRDHIMYLFLENKVIYPMGYADSRRTII